MDGKRTKKGVYVAHEFATKLSQWHFWCYAYQHVHGHALILYMSSLDEMTVKLLHSTFAMEMQSLLYKLLDTVGQECLQDSSKRPLVDARL